MRDRPPLARFVALALWLGVVGFGGGFAIAQRLKRSLVDDRTWLAPADFQEQLSVACALPGTTAANLLTIVGHRLCGVPGAILGVAAFLAPSVALMMAFGATYDRVRAVGAVAAVMDGMSAATAGVIAAVAVEMARGALKRGLDWSLAVVATAALTLGVLNLVEVVAGAALLGALALRPKRTPAEPPDQPFPPSSLRSVVLAGPAVVATPALMLFVVFARIGLVTFGGGFAMIPAIEREVVGAHGWLSEAAFYDGMVLAQITPGPVAIASTFIGYRVAGVAGAALATLGMFGPPFVLALVASRSIAAFRANRSVRGALEALAPAVVGVIAAAAITVARSSAHTLPTAAIAIATCAVLVAFRRITPLAPLALGGAAMWLLRR